MFNALGLLQASSWLLLLLVAQVGSVQRQGQGPWLRAMDATEEFEVVSIVSHLDSFSFMRTNMLADFPLKVKMLGLEGNEREKWTNLRKLTLLHEYVSGLPPEKVVFVLDFFDMVWLGCRRDLVETFRSFGRPLVLGAEFMPYPLWNVSLKRIPGGYPLFPSLDAEVSIRGPLGSRRRPIRRWLVKNGEREYRYVNSGAYFDACCLWHYDPLPMITEVPQKDDQTAWHAYLLKHRDEVALDYGAQLFLNALGFDLQDFELRGSQIWARPFQRELCFAHGNGASNLAKHLADCQRLQWQPWWCAEEAEEREDGQLAWGMMCRPPA
ncbi:unnamed protein product [Polarella glacialis]|uniref:Protein xylosyltransferase n=1 Tax=Polarella glacialis TaxID=89957 RepID=A0A813J8V2_POLGL|nr:unnamed protein product [Polarella glacialis]